jgi:hypothetical protein
VIGKKVAGGREGRTLKLGRLKPVTVPGDREEGGRWPRGKGEVGKSVPGDREELKAAGGREERGNSEERSE